MFRLRGSLLLAVVLILGFCGIASIGCLLNAKAEDRSTVCSGTLEEEKDSEIVIFLTGDILSVLQPCGCAGGQLGGFDRRGAVLKKTSVQSRLIIDTGNLVAGAEEQDEIKFGILFEAMSVLGYDLVNLWEDDFRIAKKIGLTSGMPFDIISGFEDEEQEFSPVFKRELKLDGKNLFITIAVVRSESLVKDSLELLFGMSPEKQKLNILITDNYNDDFAKKIEELELVDVVICPAVTDEPEIMNKKIKKPLFISVGRLGKYFGKLAITFDGHGQLELGYANVAINESLFRDPVLVDLYKDYQVILKEENLIEKNVRMALPDGLEYLGSKSCGMSTACHKYEYQKWSEKKHAHAYQTLVDVGSEYDPDCIICHVVGYEYETGFVSGEKSGKELRDVGCEVCHGPGSGHLEAVLAGKPGQGIREPKYNCSSCHTPERSPGYQHDRKGYMEKIIHWREQKRGVSVEEQ